MNSAMIHLLTHTSNTGYMDKWPRGVGGGWVCLAPRPACPRRTLIIGPLIKENNGSRIWSETDVNVTTRPA
jgi:hypothetical protein